jgi:hypothetical protein
MVPTTDLFNEGFFVFEREAKENRCPCLAGVET